MERFTYLVGLEDQEERLDKWLGMNLRSLSRSYIQKLIKDNLVSVNGKAAKASYHIRVDDEITFSVPEAVDIQVSAENIPLSILYEDEDILIVDKPKGMVVHPAAGHMSGTLVNAVLYHCKEQLSGINGVLRPGIVHRIDKDTSGSLIICKNDLSHKEIAMQLKEHSITRLYAAIAHGRFDKQEGSIEAPIGRDPTNRIRMALNDKNGKYALTHYKVLDTYKNHTYLEFRLETGRTHQIRVHMASIGHPLLGDILYGAPKSKYTLQGQTLHARVIGFHHPRTGEYIEAEAPLPAYFEHLLAVLER